MQRKIFSTEWAGKTLQAEFNDLAGKANGSVLLTYGETVILVTAVMSKEDNPDLSYFPLSVEFEEKFYAAGAILGSRFMRREGKPSDEAVLSARIIDRTIRPLFNQQLKREVQIVVTVLAIGEDDPDILGVVGASLALGISDIPWAGPVGVARIAQSQNGDIFLNPTYHERSREPLNFELLACGQGGTINMIETAANEVGETEIIDLLEAATAINNELETWQQEIIKEIGKSKIVATENIVSPEVTELFATKYQETLYNTIFSDTPGKAHIEALGKKFIEEANALETGVSKNTLRYFWSEAIDVTIHHGALVEGKRADGRDFTTVRPLFAKAGGISPVLHGSGIFYRGDTHIFTALTLGGPEAAQIIDTVESSESKKTFMHHYNFPPFSVGETGRVGGFNRRMIGHGALAEKALAPLIPDQTEFPYTIRLVSETLTSNGSSSMGSVCASTLALMDGGVPLKKPVAGIASGVMMSEGNYALLTDIQGPEDEYGDMDFKVAGTRDGITAIQMDVKVNGIPLPVLAEALEHAKAARLTILETINEAIAAPRPQLSPRAPRILSTKIDPKQIGLVIGSGGKTINKIKEDTGVTEIVIEDDGQIFITGTSEAAAEALAIIKAMTKTYEVGEKTVATVTKIAAFGAFAKLDDFHEGLIHISEIADRRLETLERVLNIGEIVPVVVTKIEDGKIGLSIKQIDPNYLDKKK